MTGDDVRVFRHPNALLVSHVHNVLASAGLVPTLRNMTLGGGAGELPPGECEPEVWVPAGHRLRAEALVEEALDGPAEPLPDWRCPFDSGVCAVMGRHRAYIDPIVKRRRHENRRTQGNQES